MGEYNAETKTLSAFVGTPASPFIPDFNGFLRAIRLCISRDAASTLCNHVHIVLNSVSFKPNNIDVGANGAGLQTAPALGDITPQDWVVDQPVKASIAIALQGENKTADTPVGVLIEVYGLFEITVTD
jgi:hypothetical protein